MSQVSRPNDAYNPTARMKFTLPVSVPNGGRDNRGVATGSVPIYPFGRLTRRRFAAIECCVFVHVADRGRPDRFTNGTCRLRRGSSWSASAPDPGIPATSLTSADSGTSGVAVSYPHPRRNETRSGGADLRRKRRQVGAFVPRDLIERIRGYRANQDPGSRLPAALFYRPQLGCSPPMCPLIGHAPGSLTDLAR